MKNNPLISIIIPVYNTAKYLPRCLDSVINQTYHNLEIIIIDDGSTDNSYKIAQKYAVKDSRIKLIHQKNSGQSSARNKGLSLSKGNFIGFVDSDDEIDKKFIDSLLEPYKKNHNTSISVCGIQYRRLKISQTKNVFTSNIRLPKKKETFKNYILYLLAIDGRMYSSVNKLYKAETAAQCRFDEKTNFAEDTKFVLEYLSKAPGPISFILKPLYIYNFGTETSTINKSSIIWKNWEKLYEHLQQWAKNNSNLKTFFWLIAIRLRWVVSFLRSKHRAKP